MARHIPVPTLTADIPCGHRQPAAAPCLQFPTTTAAGEMEKLVMSKRLISLVLCVLMLASIFMTSCAKEEIVLDTSASALTLTMMAITDTQVYYTDEEYEALSEEEKAHVAEVKAQYDAVEEAINKITKSKYKTQLDIFYFTAEQYFDMLEAKMLRTEVVVEEAASARKAYKNFQRTEKRNGNTDELDVYTKFCEAHPEYVNYIEAPIVVDEDAPETEKADKEIVYPTVDPDQVDILFVGSYDQYMNYIEKGWLSKLNDVLNSGVAKKLQSYVYPAFLDAAKTDKGTYAIPNNTIVGEYTVLLVNKEMCNKYSDINQISTLYDTLSLIEDVAKYETDIDPVWSKSYRGYTNVHFWSVEYIEGEVEETVINEDGTTSVTTKTTFEYNINPTRFSPIGAVYNPDYTTQTSDAKYYAPSNLLQNQTFYNQVVALKTLEYNNYYGAKDSTNEFAVGVVKGSGKDLEVYEEDYYSVVLEYPVATQEDLFGSMFAVSSFTTDLNRSMEILTLLNTDTDFRNLFQYGIVGTNYEVNDEDCAERLPDNLYMMDVYKTGNVFVAYPDADKGMSQKTWEYAKTQDLDVKINPTIGFTITSEDLPSRKGIDDTLRATYEFEEKINSCTSVPELTKTLGNLAAQIEAGTYMKDIKQFVLNPVTTEESNYSLAALYRIWCLNMGYVKEA